MNNLFRILACWTITFLFLFTAGCTYITPGEPEELVPIKTVGVFPVQITNLQKPVAEETQVELENGVDAINLLLADYFRDYRNVNLISESELDGLPSAATGKPFYLASEAGKQLHYDAILITTLSRYQDRDGSEFAVKRPASVAFSLRLLAVESGQIIWSADFDQTQQPLFENILPNTRSTGSGFRWLSAKELASAGLSKKLNSSPYLKRD